MSCQSRPRPCTLATPLGKFPAGGSGVCLQARLAREPLGRCGLSVRSSSQQATAVEAGWMRALSASRMCGGSMPQHRDNRVRPADEHAAAQYHHPAAMEVCCVPTGCHLLGEPIRVDDLSDAVRVICNNEQCPQSPFMHRTCFEEWESSVLSFLRSTGRARSWSEKQRLQNLWTKKGYDLAYKACGCRCGKGHLRKDLDWIPPVADRKKKQRRRKGNDKPTLALNGAKPPSSGGLPVTRLRSSSMSSTGSGGSPPSSSSEFPPSPTHAKRGLADREGSGLFSRRQDYSSFNTLPRHKINAYHIKMEDEGDDIRCFILTTLSANKMSRIPCIVCQTAMSVFDRYPLVDGTLFLSPRQHNPGSVLVRVDERPQYLNAVCMTCLEGWQVRLACRGCGARWSGRHLILGTMYAYDIFAATPCCDERRRCASCREPVISADRSLPYFSDYSHSICCAHCGARDYHFVKSLGTYARV
ncbi:hdc homolog, cell cycle regulator [Dermacentor variabilis]|uniref:hdc homolog, cell cycle regulator n=1 Tax=Dermacentor variabilis TaxID=34621 RepID=UPI003F5AE04B